jgi:hypothetical protein
LEPGGLGDRAVATGKLAERKTAGVRPLRLFPRFRCAS